MSNVIQFSTIQALLVGLYDGVFSVQDVQKAGTIGLGCSCGIDGELVLTQQTCYVARAHQPLSILKAEDKIPFAQVAHFEPTLFKKIENITNKDILNDLLIDFAQTENLFLGFRIQGKFKKIVLRQPPTGLSKPYPPMTEVFKDQTEQTLENIEGTLIGFWSPKAYQGVTVAGEHIHFIDTPHQQGGHVLDVNIEHANLEMQIYAGIDIRLSTDETFLKANLDYENIDEDIQQAES